VWLKGRLLYCDGSCKRHAVLPSLAEAAQLQATVNPGSGNALAKTQIAKAESGRQSYQPMPSLSGGLSCVCEASLKAINMEIIRRYMYGLPATFHLSPALLGIMSARRGGKIPSVALPHVQPYVKVLLC
jgi:hypothetical protein